MQDIFRRTVFDYDVVSFPFVTHGPYMNSRPSIHLSYGVVKGSRVYTLNNEGKLIHKVIHSPETMMLKLDCVNIPLHVSEKIEEIRSLMAIKYTK